MTVPKVATTARTRSNVTVRRMEVRESHSRPEKDRGADFLDTIIYSTESGRRKTEKPGPVQPQLGSHKGPAVSLLFALGLFA